MTNEMFKYLAAGITMLGGAIGAGYGLATVFAAWLSSLARNPEASGKLQMAGFIGFAGTELVLLMCFVVASLLLFAV